MTRIARQRARSRQGRTQITLFFTTPVRDAKRRKQQKHEENTPLRDGSHKGWPSSLRREVSAKPCSQQGQFSKQVCAISPCFDQVGYNYVIPTANRRCQPKRSVLNRAKRTDSKVLNEAEGKTHTSEGRAIQVFHGHQILGKKLQGSVVS